MHGHTDVDVHKLFDALLDILPGLMKTFMTQRRYVKQASVLGALSAYLLVIQGEGDEDDLSSEVMNELELMCTWPKRSIDTTQSRTPTLRALSSPTSPEELSRVSKSVSVSLHAFASATPKERAKCKQFAKARTSAETFVPANTLSGHAPRSAKHSITPEDYPSFVNMMLYDTMRKYTACHCDNARKAVEEHEAKLCLWNRSRIDQGLVDFDMHFWSQSCWDLTKQNCHWQQLRLHVPSKRYKLKKVHLLEPQTGAVSQAADSSTHRARDSVFPNSAEDTLSNNDFCILLRNSIGPAKVRLKVVDSTLLRLHEPDETDQVLLSKPSISLARVLQQHRLSTKMKIGLAYTLARSVWQYYDSEWMGSEWTCKTIHFMLEDSADSKHSCLHSSRPCITVRFQNSTQSVPKRCDLAQVIHKYPRVLALGMLLIDIARTSYDAGGSAAVAQTQQEKANTDYMVGRKISERDSSWPDLGTADAARQRLRTVYKAATQSCFDKNIFKDISICTEAGGESAEAEEHRRILYERVVWPLENIIEDMGWTHSLGHIEAITLDEMPSSQTHSDLISASPGRARALSPATKIVSSDQSQRQRSSTFDEAALFDDETTVEGPTEEQREAFKSWKARFREVYEEFIPEQLPISVAPVRVAVLDTGIDLSNTYIEVHEDRISGHNWMKKPKARGVSDTHGHGTHISGLILDLIPDSELYVAKISDGKGANPEALARAIDYAVEQRFDIISISVGFSRKVSGYEDLEKAIERALYARMLIFAAASNGGGNNDRAYPAREKDVFCIHSTDAKGTRSRFSPTAEEFVYNFATIGEAVESFWPTKLCANGEQFIRVKSGTSFATPIAASIAAFLLLYAKIHLGAEESTRLKRHSAMESLLHELSKGSRAKRDRDDYQYLFLSRHPDTLFGRDVEDINNSFRKCI